MKRNTPLRTSYAYIVQPANKLDLLEQLEPNELGETLSNFPVAPNVTTVSATRLLARRLKRQKRFS